MKKHHRIPPSVADEVLFPTDHTCCVCRTKGRDVQIHHIDGNRSNNKVSNLAVVCLDCHSKLTGSRGLGRAYSQGEVMCNADEIVKEIDGLEDIYLRCKSIFPKLGQNMVGCTEFRTARHYGARGYNVTVKVGTSITGEFLKGYTETGNWINENAIIRLYGIMTYYNLLGGNIRIDQTIQGWKEVDLMRRMRNVFTKTRLNYEPDDPENVRLKEEIISYFELEEDEYVEGEIPTTVNTVIQPIFDGCRKYVRGRCGNT